MKKLTPADVELLLKGFATIDMMKGELEQLGKALKGILGKTNHGFTVEMALSGENRSLVICRDRDEDGFPIHIYVRQYDRSRDRTYTDTDIPALKDAGFELVAELHRRQDELLSTVYDGVPEVREHFDLLFKLGEVETADDSTS